VRGGGEGWKERRSSASRALGYRLRAQLANKKGDEIHGNVEKGIVGYSLKKRDSRKKEVRDATQRKVGVRGERFEKNVGREGRFGPPRKKSKRVYRGDGSPVYWVRSPRSSSEKKNGG